MDIKRSGELWRNRIHRVVIHLCSPLLCQTSWLQRQLLKDGIILLTIFVGIASVRHQVLTISLSHGIVTRTELVYRMLVTLLYVSKQRGNKKGIIDLPVPYTSFYIPVAGYGNKTSDWWPTNSTVVVLVCSLSQLYVNSREGLEFYFLTVGV